MAEAGGRAGGRTWRHLTAAFSIPPRFGSIPIPLNFCHVPIDVETFDSIFYKRYCGSIFKFQFYFFVDVPPLFSINLFLMI